jgi:co-chaperonin GroES (HSP10)
LIEPYGGTEILHEGSKYVLVADSGVVAYLEEGKDTAK